MNGARHVPARWRAGLTLVELLIAIAALGVMGTLLLMRRAPEPSPSPPAPEEVYVAVDTDSEPAEVPGNLLVNGSFEETDDSEDTFTRSGFRTYRDSIPGWRITEGTVDVKSSFWQQAPGQGRQSLDLVGSPGAATIEQTFGTVPGREYLFTGWLAHNPENPNAPEGRAEVSINGEPLTELFHRDPRATTRDMRWERFAHRFRATIPETTLTISDVTGHGEYWGTALDGLAVTPITRNASPPSPAVECPYAGLLPPPDSMKASDSETALERKEP